MGSNMSSHRRRRVSGVDDDVDVGGVTVQIMPESEVATDLASSRGESLTDLIPCETVHAAKYMPLSYGTCTPPAPRHQYRSIEIEPDLHGEHQREDEPAQGHEHGHGHEDEDTSAHESDDADEFALEPTPSLEPRELPLDTVTRSALEAVETISISTDRNDLNDLNISGIDGNTTSGRGGRLALLKQPSSGSCDDSCPFGIRRQNATVADLEVVMLAAGSLLDAQ